jgi:hypothetical protein
MAEFWSTLLVVGEDIKLCELIENTDTPDFEAFDRKLDEVRKAWGKYDSHIEGYAVRGRLFRFKHEHKNTNGTDETTTQSGGSVLYTGRAGSAGGQNEI